MSVSADLQKAPSGQFSSHAKQTVKKSTQCDFAIAVAFAIRPMLTYQLGLVYGAFFGFICLHEPQLYTQHGQVKDDLERTLDWDDHHSFA